MKHKLKSNALDTTIGANIYKARIKLGITQAELALRVGVSYQQMQKYEHGTDRTSSSMLWRIAKEAGLPLTFFFDEDIPGLVIPYNKRQYLHFAQIGERISKSPHAKQILALINALTGE